MNPAAQTLQVECFLNFIEIFLPMSIYNLNYFNCTMVGEEMQEKKEKKNEVFQKTKKNQMAVLVSHSPDCLLIYSYCLSILISLI